MAIYRADSYDSYDSYVKNIYYNMDYSLFNYIHIIIIKKML